MDNFKKMLVQDERYVKGIEACLDKPNVLIAPTNYCNFSCSYCSTKNIKNKNVNIELDLAKSIVDQCMENDWEFSFGQTYEPFLHPQIGELILYIHEKGRIFNSPTNAIAIKKSAFNLPMNLLISYSANEKDYAFRNSAMAYATYERKILDFVRHRIDNRVEGVISLQIADYSIFAGDFTYDKRITEVEQIFQKSQGLLRLLGLDCAINEPAWRDDILQRRPLVLFAEQGTTIQVQPTKIMPNTFEAFMEMPAACENAGYCDSCYTMMSIQADGDVAFCCCDPTAQAVAGRIDRTTDLRAFWLGKEMSEVRESFLRFKPKHASCSQCLRNVSENTKPLLTVRNPDLVAEILSSRGVREDLPWFSFPKHG